MYFLTASEREQTGSTCFHEFYKGKWDEEKMIFWSEDSLYLDDDVMYSLKLGRLFYAVNSEYDRCGVTEITEMMWNKVSSLAAAEGGELAAAVKELAPWAEANFKEHRIFTILGI